MNSMELMNYGNQLQQQGRLDSAIDAFRGAAGMPSPFQFGPAFLNIHAILIQRGDKAGALQALVDFMNCPLLPSTMEVVGKVKGEIENLKQQLNPPPPK